MGNELVIGGIVIGGVITALVQLLKNNGLPSQYAPWVNLVLSFIFSVVGLFITQNPQYLTVVTVALQVLIVFLAASGVYTTATWATETKLGRVAKVE